MDSSPQLGRITLFAMVFVIQVGNEWAANDEKAREMPIWTENETSTRALHSKQSILMKVPKDTVKIT